MPKTPTTSGPRPMPRTCDDDTAPRNAVIKLTEITADDHGVLSAWIHLDFGGQGQGFGGYVLYSPPGCAQHKILSCAGHFIWRVLEIAGVTRWEDLRGRTLRVRGSHSGIEAIGHILNDDWFSPSVDFGDLP